MKFKVVKQLKPIGAIQSFTKHNFYICVEEHLTILNKLRDKRITLMNKNLEIYGACCKKMTFHNFFLSTDYPVNGLNG